MGIHKPADNPYAKVVIYGPHGHGKTHFLGTAQADERTSPMLILDFEGGVDDTLAGLDVDVFPIRSWEDYSEAYELLSEPNTPYRSVGIDSISETHIWALLDILGKAAPKENRNDPDLLEQRDYGKASVQLRRLLREFRDLPLHVFYTAGAKEDEERGIGKVAKPALAGQMSNEVVGLMSVAGYLALTEDEEGEVERVLLLQNYPKFRTKIRMPWGEVAPDELVQPSVTSLLDAMHIATPPKREGKKPSKKTTTKGKE